MPEDPSGDNPERPDWLPEKFKSVDAFVAAYGEAERRITEQGQQLAAQNETLSTFSQQLEELSAASRTPQADPSQVNNQWQELYENDPIGTMVLLNQQLAQQNAEVLRQEIRALAGSTQDSSTETTALLVNRTMHEKYADFDELKDDIAAEIENNLLLRDDDLYKAYPTAIAALEQAYRNVKTALPPEHQHSLNNERERMKLEAQGLTGAGGRPPAEDEGREAWARIKNAGYGTYSEMMSRG